MILALVVVLGLTVAMGLVLVAAALMDDGGDWCSIEAAADSEVVVTGDGYGDGCNRQSGGARAQIDDTRPRGKSSPAGRVGFTGGERMRGGGRNRCGHGVEAQHRADGRGGGCDHRKGRELMATGISWCDETWNPIRGCTRVSEGCRNCYAEAMAGRIVAMGKGKPTPYDGLVRLTSVTKYRDGIAETVQVPRWTGAVDFDATKLAEPLKRKKPTRYFVNSMSDLFHEGLTNEQIAAVFGVMAACPQHTFVVLTKRAKRMREWFGWVEREGDGHPLAVLHVEAGPHIADAIGSGDVDDAPVYAACEALLDSDWPLPNVILGVSVENQEAADERIPHLLATPAAVRTISAEPLLGPVDLAKHLGYCEQLDKCAISRDDAGKHIKCERYCGISWVIAGCESGRGARACSTYWLRSLRNQCAEAGVPFFLKQAREDLSMSGADVHHKTVLRSGPGSKRKPGGIIELPYLDGVQWAQMPVSR